MMPAATVRDVATLPAMLTPDDLQGFLGLSHYTIWKLLRTNDFPVLKIGGRYRIPKHELLEWLAHQRLRAPGEERAYAAGVGE